MTWTVERDEWGPTLELFLRKTSGSELKRFWGDLGKKIVFLLRVLMQKQRGFGSRTRYKKLKITERRHGTKTLVASKRNLARAKRGTNLERAKELGRVEVANKMPVGADTKALIDTGDLLRSWKVKEHSANGFTIGNNTPANALKALYNDDRGDWDWDDKSVDDVVEPLLDYIDKGIW